MKNEKSRRLAHLDAARVITIIWMIIGHVLYEVLDRSSVGDTVLAWWTYLRGFTSAIFLLLSGLSFGIATQKRWRPYLPLLSTQTRRRCRRFLFFLLIGYLLQFDTRLLPGGRQPAEGALDYFLSFNILHTIALSLLLLQLLLRCVGSYRYFAFLVASFAFMMIGFTPLLYTDANIPNWLRPVLLKSKDVVFPWLPTAAYLFFGTALVGVVIDFRNAELRRMRLAAMGITLFIAGYLLQHWGLWCYAVGVPSSVMPAYIALHLGGALLFLVFLSLIVPDRLAKNRWVRHIAQESLTAYVVHIVILYRLFGLLGSLRRLFRPVHNLMTSITIALIVCTVTLLLSLLWHKVKSKAGRGRRLTKTVLIAYIFSAIVYR